MNNTTRLTEGKIIPCILKFAIPLVLTALFQQLYSFADSVIIGNFVGVNSFAAVGATQSLYFLLLSVTMGMAMGFCIPLAQCFGSADMDEFSQNFWNGLYLCAVISAVFCSVASAFTAPLLRLIHTPEELFADAECYLYIIFIGLPVTILYNYLAGVLRSVGDSKRPFYFLIIASLINIVLDLALILGFKAGVAGAAIATVASQFFSVLFAAYWLWKRTRVIKRSSENRKLTAVSLRHMAHLCAVGIPMGLEFSISTIGSVLLQSSVNSLGSVAVAGQAAGEKIRSIATLPLENVGVTMSTFVAQNIGAKQIARVKKGIRGGVIIQICYCAVAWGVLLFAKAPLLTLLLGSAENAVFDAALRYIGIISTLFITHGLLMISRYSLQGLGLSGLAVLSGFCETLGRLIGGRLAVAKNSFDMICVTNPLCWIIALIYCATVLAIALKRRTRAEENILPDQT